ncbi:MAG: ABC transporter permease, partial [Chloroflexaceae bacterium]|nr:ABC transporter permease [Chloroflexaceae bacterium]
MTTFLVRRLLQMAVVVVLASMVAYALLNLAPGGPIDQLLAERQNSGARRIDQDDIDRVMQRFELDLYLPVRFSRWLIGFPSGPVLGLGDVQVGCLEPGRVRLTNTQTGEVTEIEEGCARPVTLASL